MGAAEGKTIKHDISLPISRIAAFIASTDAAIEREFSGQRMVVFGHLGDVRPDAGLVDHDERAVKYVELSLLDIEN